MSTQPDQVSATRESMTPRQSATSDSRRTAVVTPVSAERFDEYALIAKLGEGGMAQVYLAVSQGPGGFRKLVCVKRLHGHLSQDPAQVDLFTQEANLAAGLHHPNIVQTNRVGSARGRPFLTMEYLDGQPLSRVLYRLRSQGRHLPPAVVAQVVAFALDGLHYAHHASDYAGVPLGIVHRDISPHNLFLTYEGEVKLLDFGIAKSERHSQEDAGLVRGKFGYIAPEQARQEAIDGRTDVWGMGVTLWESLVGRRLFQGESEVSVLRASLSDEIPFAAEVAGHVPEALARIAEGALQRNPERRFQSALQFKQALEAWLSEERQADFRKTLSSCLKELFADRIEERAVVLRSSLARLASERAQVFATSGAPALAEVAAPLPRQSLLQVVSPAAVATVGAERNRRIKAFALVSAAVVGGLLAVFGKNVEARGAAREPVVEARGAEARAAELTVRPAAANTDLVPALAKAPLEARPVRSEVIEAERVRDPEHVVLDVYAQPKKARAKHVIGGSTPLPKAALPLAERAESEEEPSESLAKGRLKLDSTPYAVVFLRGEKLGITPIDIELPAATHTLTLRNPEQGIETSYRVVVPAGESIERRIALE